jgi:hypothetical protein
MPLLKTPEFREVVKSVLQEITESKKPEVNPDEVIDADEACVLLGTPGKPVSKAWLYRESHFGRIPGKFKFGNRLRFRKSDLLQLKELYTAEAHYKDEVIYQQIRTSAEKKLKK